MRVTARLVPNDADRIRRSPGGVPSECQLLAKVHPERRGTLPA